MNGILILRILHISDLHAGSDAAWWISGRGDAVDYNKLFSGEFAHEVLLSHVRANHGEDFDLIAVTGDLTHRGERREMDVVSSFLQELREGLRCSRTKKNRPHLIVVPGNHDISWQPLKQAEKEGKYETFSTQGLYEMKFKEFRDTLKRLGLDTDGEVPFAFDKQFMFSRHVPMHSERKDEKQWAAIGLNSAVLGSHRIQDQHGQVLFDQLLSVKQKCLLGFSPWEFRLALLHHDPILMPYGADPDLSVIQPAQNAIESAAWPSDKEKQLASRPYDELKRAGNYLWGTTQLLDQLSQMGVQLVLAGHYHLPEPQHYVFPRTPEKANPFGHGGITVLRAGSVTQGSRLGFQVVEVYQSNFRFTVSAYTHRIALDHSGEFLSCELQRKEPYEFPCYTNRPVDVVDGLIRMLAKGYKGPVYCNELRDREVTQNHNITANRDLYCGTVLDVPPQRIRLSPPSRAMLHPFECLRDIDDWPKEELARDVRAVIWHRLCGSLLTNASVYADLPHWSLSGIKRCETEKPPAETSQHEYECSFDTSYYLHYQLLNLGLNDSILRCEDTMELHSFRDKYFLPEERRKRYCDLNLCSLDEYLRSHLFLGLRTTLQVVFYVYDMGPNGSVLLKIRSPNVGHFPSQIQLPVGGGFKSVLFGLGQVRDMGQAVREETRLETGVSLQVNSCIGLTVNTRTFCPAFTFLIKLSKMDLAHYFLEGRQREVETDRGELLRVTTYEPVPDNEGALPRDWWEGEFLTPVELKSRPKKHGYDLYALLLRTIGDFFDRTNLRSKLDEYVGACIELYICDRIRTPFFLCCQHDNLF